MPHPQSGKFILLVEDEAIIAMNESKLLERSGYRVKTVTSGEKAISAVKENRFDLILMDIDLGKNKMDGTEAAERILEDQDVPVVFLSSHTEPEIVEKTEGITSYGYIVKNSGETVLLASLRMAFRLFEAKQITEESERKYHNLFENMIEEGHLWKLVRDKHGTIKTWELADVNHAGLKSWKKTRAETIGKTVDEIWPDSNVTELFMPIVKKIFEDGKPHTWESYFAGTDQILNMTSVAFGEYFFSTGMDVTDRKRIEASLQLSEQKLKEAQHIAKIGSWDMDPVTGEGYWSDELFHLLGYEPGEKKASYSLFRDHVHPEDVKRFEETIAEFVERERQVDEVFRFRKKDGEIRIAHSVGKVEFDETGNPCRVYGTFQDITEGKKSKESLQRILDSIPEDIYITDMDTYEILFMNEQMKDSFPKANTGDICYKVFRNEQEPCKHCTNKDLLNENNLPKDAVKWECRNPVNGKWYLNYDKAVPWIDGKNVRLQIAADITDRKQFEESLQNAVKEKDYLMKELNHRVKNNLLMVTSLINLKNESLGEQVDLSDLVHQIDAVRIVHEKLYQSDHITHVDLGEYVDELLDTIFSFDNRTIKIVNDMSDIVIPTKTAGPIGLIINEIATNAVKHGFTDSAEAQFAVKLKKATSEKQYVLTLSNTGNPFPEKINFDNPETLGLRLISALVDQLQGTIALQREPYPVFTIRFPMEREAGK